MVKQLLKSVREFKKDALLTPLFVVLEVVMEVLIPFVMAELIDKGIDAQNMSAIGKYGFILVACAMLALVFGAAGTLVGGLGLLVERQRSLRLLLLLRAVEFAVVDVHILRIQRLTAGAFRHRLVFGGRLLRSLAVRFAEQAFYILQKRVDVVRVRCFRRNFLFGLRCILVFHTMFSFHFPRSRGGWWKESPINIVSL